MVETGKLESAIPFLRATGWCIGLAWLVSRAYSLSFHPIEIEKEFS